MQCAFCFFGGGRRKRLRKCGRPRGRGARRRRNKGLKGVKHHAGLEEGRFGPGGVVPVDDGTRVCGERSTTPDWRKADSGPGAWCPSTTEQGFAGREAPRRIGGRPVRARGRGARRRRNRGLREVTHHARLEESRFGPGGVVPVDEEQGLAGSEAPRRIGGRPIRARGRGARRRRNKGLREVKHHAGLEKSRFGPGGVVLVDEGTRV